MSVEVVRKELKHLRDRELESLRSLVRSHTNAAKRLDALSRLAAGREQDDLESPLLLEVSAWAEIPKYLAGVMGEVVKAVTFIESDQESMVSAAGRITTGRKPAGKSGGGFQDCLIIETCLTLCRLLAQGGHDRPRIFVSANIRDFYDQNSGGPHPDLVDECDRAGLQFARNLSHARSLLGLS